MAGLDVLSKLFRRSAAAPVQPAPPPAIAFAYVPVPDEIRGGRSVHDGYQRGCGLMHTDLPIAIAADPLYRAAVEAAGGWSIMVDTKRMDIFLLLTRFMDKLDCQNIIEFGSYRGGNALFMAAILRELYPQAKVYALDTYAGMPETDLTRDVHYAGDFGDSSADALEARRDALGLTNLVVVKGLFDQTFPTIAASGMRFGMAHIDCDIYSAVKYAQGAVWPHMTKGGYLVYDDADVPSCIGATEAVEELVMERRLHAEQVWPHWIFRTGLN